MSVRSKTIKGRAAGTIDIRIVPCLGGDGFWVIGIDGDKVLRKPLLVSHTQAKELYKWMSRYIEKKADS